VWRRAVTKAFTLIELLAVIGIILVLAALIFPTVQGVKKKADTTVCASNLHQIGVAMSLYASENQTALPGPTWSTQPPLASKDNFGVVWLGGFLAPYMGINLPNGPTTSYVTVPLLFCPVNLRYKMARGSSMWNLMTSVDIDRLTRSPWGHPQGSGDLKVPVRIIRIANAGTTWALQERDQGTSPKPVHGSVRNTLFFDWHVETVRVP